jgi:hypothetical protein
MGAFGWVKNSYYSGLALFRVTIRHLDVFGLANSHYSLFVFCGICHYSTILTKCWNSYSKIENSSILATILDSSKRRMIYSMIAICQIILPQTSSK